MVTPGLLNRRAALFEQLATMIAAGTPLIRALEMASRNRSAGLPRKVLQELTYHLREGHTFADAMQFVSGQKRGTDGRFQGGGKFYWLSEFDIALLSAGEQSGRLDATLKLLAQYYAARAKMISDTIGGSIITIVTLHVFLIIFPVPLLVSFVMAFVNNQYSECLPFLIEKVCVFGVLYFLVWFSAYAGQANRNQSWRAFLEDIFGCVPLLRTGLKYLAVARLAMALDALLSAGVPVIKSWNLAAAACGSPHLKREILKWSPELEKAMTPAEMVARIRYFPDLFVELYQSGEISGRLDESLIHLYNYFQQEGFRKLQAFSRVVMFTVYFAIAIIVGYYIIGFWVGYYHNLFNSI
ncbi:MAG TPA: type II secretion system F family protein [Verrucomicrobiae bacterium]